MQYVWCVWPHFGHQFAEVLTMAQLGERFHNRLYIPAAGGRASPRHITGRGGVADEIVRIRW